MTPVAFPVFGQLKCSSLCLIIHRVFVDSEQQLQERHSEAPLGLIFSRGFKFGYFSIDENIDHQIIGGLVIIWPPMRSFLGNSYYLWGGSNRSPLKTTAWEASRVITPDKLPK